MATFAGYWHFAAKQHEFRSQNEQNITWITALRENPLVPGTGVAGLKIGDTEKSISARFKQKGPQAFQVVGRGNEIFLDKRNGLVLHYAINFREAGLFLGIYTERDKRTITSFRISDENFNKSRFLPSYKGVTIGSTKADLLATLGEPARKDESYGCPASKSSNPKVDEYYYEGISFWICETNNLVYLIDIY